MTSRDRLEAQGRARAVARNAAGVTRAFGSEDRLDVRFEVFVVERWRGRTRLSAGRRRESKQEHERRRNTHKNLAEGSREFCRAVAAEGASMGLSRDAVNALDRRGQRTRKESWAIRR